MLCFQEEMAGYLDESSQMSDIRIHVKEISTGKILRGEEAPLASELENWLKENPGYVEVPRDEVQNIAMFVMKRRSKKIISLISSFL